MTLIQDNNNKKVKRQGFDEIWPVPATTPLWPFLVYTGPNGQPTTTAPTVAFPTPPASIGPDAPPSPRGSWPKRAIQPVAGLVDNPWVDTCAFLDFSDLCIVDPLLYGAFGGDPDAPDDDENWAELQTTCSLPKSSSSTRTTVTKASKPAPSPYETGDPMQNEVECYNSGRKISHVRLDNAENSFCNDIGAAGEVLAPGYAVKSSYPFSGYSSDVVVISIKINKNCDWPWSLANCRTYLGVPVDSCNCKGYNGKQGGIVRNVCYTFRIDPNKG